MKPCEFCALMVLWSASRSLAMIVPRPSCPLTLARCALDRRPAVVYPLTCPSTSVSVARRGRDASPRKCLAKSMSAIVDALAAGASERVKPAPVQAIEDAYAALKALIVTKYPAAATPVQAVEERPTSEP